MKINTTREINPNTYTKKDGSTMLYLNDSLGLIRSVGWSNTAFPDLSKFTTAQDDMFMSFLTAFANNSTKYDKIDLSELTQLAPPLKVPEIQIFIGNDKIYCALTMKCFNLSQPIPYRDDFTDKEAFEADYFINFKLPQ